MQRYCPLVTNAHDFEVDGIYYNITSEEAKTAEVTFKGDSYWVHDEYSNSVTLPVTVTYDGVAYSVTSILVSSEEKKNHKEVEKNNPKGLLLQFANYVYGHSTIK